jgi:hypothetical protein
MNSIQAKIKKIVEEYPDELNALKNIGIRYLTKCSAIDIDNSVLIAHRPWLGVMNFAIRFFPPAKKTWLTKFKEKKIPECYRQFLLATNGAFVFGLSLYGLAPSMQKTPHLLDRSSLQCHDLSLANQDWIKDYRTDLNAFYFGSRAFSYRENLGYFIFGNLKIKALRQNGEIYKEWDSFSLFLEDEIKQAEQQQRNETNIE